MYFLCPYVLSLRTPIHVARLACTEDSAGCDTGLLVELNRCFAFDLSSLDLPLFVQLYYATPYTKNENFARYIGTHLLDCTLS